jgi:uncharacterized protein YbjT (DUF2867 family)
MTRILIAGATGLVGGHVLRRALSDDRVTAIVAPTRRPLPPHDKLSNPVSDLSTLPDDDAWWAVDGVVCTLGTTRAKAGSAAAFRAVDLDLQLAVARRARAHGARRFALTSSTGADPRSRFVYLRTKGELEEAVRDLGFPSLTIVRPGVILGERTETRVAERAFVVALRAIGSVLPTRLRGNRADRIAQALLDAAVAAPDGSRVIGPAEIG